MRDHVVKLTETSESLRAVLEAAEAPTSSVNRRQAILGRLGELLQADAGHWAWGRGWPDNDAVLPVAVINFGYSDLELAEFYRFSLDARLRDDVSLPLLALRREDRVSCAVRRDAWPDDQWTADNWAFQTLQRRGKDSWLHCVRYAANDAWSNMLLVRNVGKSEFGPAEKELVDLAFKNIPWLWANDAVTAPHEAVEALSPQQRAMLLLVLDGLSPKTIAGQLGVSIDSVDRRLTTVLQHFHVQSASELAALLLRSR